MKFSKTFCLNLVALTMASTLFLSGSAMAEQIGITKEVVGATRYDTSPPLRDLLGQITAPVPPTTVREIENIFLKTDQQWLSDLALQQRPIDARVQRSVVGGPPAPIVDSSFEGLNNTFGVLPPDTNGDVGTTQYVQYINLGWAIFDKATGNLTAGPMAGNAFWTGFGGICETNNSGDPIVLYDEVADRWMFSQFTGSGQPAQCFAISTTADPLGPYNRYEFPFTPFNDYPHIGIWADQGGAQSSYVFVTHDFNGNVFEGASFVAVDRTAMLAGNMASLVRFQGFNAYGALPPHLEGTGLPQAGTCAPFVHMRSQRDGYRVWNLCVDWNTPANSTISAEIPLLSEVFSQGVGSIPQAGTMAELDSFGLNTMYRASVRVLGTGGFVENAMVINHVTNVGGNQAGVRWAILNIPNPGEVIHVSGFELTDPLKSGPRLVDYGSYAPTTEHRWMGGIAMDQDGNIGLGYSVSSDVTSPELRLAGRDFGSPEGVLSPEVQCTIGATGSQTSSSGRWGDYASMSLDPVDQCTFWFTSEYYATTGNASWTTRVCSFHMPNCGQGGFRVIDIGSGRVEMCTATDADPNWRIDAMTTGSFSGPVNLSASSLPVGTNASFSQAALSSFPAVSVVSLNNATSLADGEYSFQVVGTGTIGTSQQVLTLGVSQNLPPISMPTSPANSATGVSVRPLLVWNMIADATSYRVELATDVNFINIIDTIELTANSHAPAVTLNSLTAYFWRVIAINFCGEGTVSATQTFTTGTPGSCPGGTAPNIAFSDDIESGINGWTTSGPGNTWAQQASTATDGLNGQVWFGLNVDSTTDQYLDSPAIVIPAGQQPSTLSYMTYYDLEQDAGTGDCWDGGLLEVSTDGTIWTQLDDSVMLTNPYTGVILPNPDSPIDGKAAWCGQNGPVLSVVDVSAYAGSTVQFRYRLGTDGNTANDGWYLDDVEVQTCQ